MEQFQFTFRQVQKGELSSEIQQLIDAAAAATERAYAPYSKFKVGAAILMNDGSIHVGANQENASYPAGICAERAVLSSLNLNDTDKKVVAIAVTYEPHGNEDKPISPCGICRQYMLEVELHQATPIAVYMCSPDGQVVYVEQAGHLLPFFFSNEHLPA
jgi:cytidine deaminase